MMMMNTRGKSVLKKPNLDSIVYDVAPSMSRKDFVKSSVRKITQRHFSFQLTASLYGKCLQMLNEYNRNSRDRGRQNTTEKHIKQNSTNSFFLVHWNLPELLHLFQHSWDIPLLQRKFHFQFRRGICKSHQGCFPALVFNIFCFDEAMELWLISIYILDIINTFGTCIEEMK